MNKKALMERKTEILEQMEAILNVCEMETREFLQQEDSEYSELETELRSVIDQLNTNEKRGEMKHMKNNLEIRQAVKEVIEGRSMTHSANGSLVPEYLHGEVVKVLPEVAPLFAKVDLLTPVNGTVRVARESDLGLASFVGENEELSLTDVKMEFVELTQKRAGSAIEVSEKLINDSGIDIVKYSQDLLFRRLGFALDRAMIAGDGNKTIEGLKQAPATCKMTTKQAGSLAIEDLMNVMVNMNPAYSNGAVWIMTRANFAKLAMLKDGNGHFYVTREYIQNSISYRLFGAEILINDACGEKEIYLVNLMQAYKGMIKKSVELKDVMDKGNALKGVRTLVLDTYVDAKIVQPEAIKVLTV